MLLKSAKRRLVQLGCIVSKSDENIVWIGYTKTYEITFWLFTFYKTAKVDVFPIKGTTSPDYNSKVHVCHTLH